MIKKYFMAIGSLTLAFGVLVGCGTVGDDQNYNNRNNLQDVRNPGLNDVTPRDVDFNDNNNINDNNRLNNVGDEYEPDLDEEPSEQFNDNVNNNDLNNMNNNRTDRSGLGQNSFDKNNR